MAEKATDHLTFTGAAQLAMRIERHWRAKGNYVRAWAEELTPGVWGVRSTLFNGKPRGAT